MTENKHPYRFHLLLHSADLVKDYLRSKLLPLGISPEQARIVKALGHLGPVSQATLAREFDITAASMSTMTSRLIALDFIICEKDPLNAKRNLVSLTSKGTALLDEISRVWTGVDTYIEEKIGANKLEDLAELTLTLRDALGGSNPSFK